MHDFKAFPELTDRQMELYYFDSPHKQITQSFWAKIIKVHDGDTFTLRCDFRDFDFPVRLSKIDSPELNNGGQIVRQWVERWILGREVYVLIDPFNRVEKWGRLLGDIVCDGLSVSEAELREGFALPFGQRKEFTPIPNLNSEWLSRFEVPLA